MFQDIRYPTENEGRSVELFPLTEAVLGVGGRDNLVRSGGLLLAATGLVLLIACGNVASLLLARAMERRKEIAVRLSVGAPRWRLIRQLLAESGVLAVLGGSAGILVATFGRDLLWSFRPTGMRDDFLDLTLEPQVLWFTVGLSLVTGILFGLIPAIQGSRLDLVSAIKSQMEAPSRGGRWTLGLDMRDLLVTGQVAVSLLALIGAGLFLRSLHEAQRLNPGFRTEGLAVMFVNVGAQGYSPQRGMQFFRDTVERVRQLPGVQSASLGEAIPQFSGGALAVTLTTVGVYGVMAYSVTQRTHEIGIRMALGAAHADVLRMVLRHGLRLTLLGVSIGLAAAFAVTRLIASLLFVSPTDGLTFTAISALLAAVAMLASLLPARRDARVDPLVALRQEC
jgi:ABC-type antimicrobial peptide transport system permease subunit